MINTGDNSDYASKMPDLSEDANIQEALQAYHYGTIDPTTVDSSSFAAPSGFTDPDYGMVGKLKWIKTEIDAIKASGASGGIFNSIIDAKGDLIVGTADNTPAKMGAGANGYVLQVDTSNLTYGLKWGNLDDTHLNLTGGTLTGDLQISKAVPSLSILASSGASTINFEAPSGSTKGLKIKTGSSLRWELLSNSTAESSTATGSDFVINRYNNSGTLLGTVVTVTRSSGLVAFTNNITVGGTIAVTGTSAFTGDATFSGTGTFTGTVTSSPAPTSGSHLANKDFVDKSMPVGSIIAYAGSSVPAGWIVCDGSAVSRSTYAGLYAVCGTYFGSGDGSTTFNVPNLTDKFIRGGSTRGTSGGSTSITTSNMPAHDHGGATASGNATHNHSGTTAADGYHRHGLRETQSTSFQSGSNKGALYTQPSAANVTDYDGTHTHTFTTDAQNAAHTHGISSQGSGAAYWQPYYQLIYIIKSA